MLWLGTGLNIHLVLGLVRIFLFFFYFFFPGSWNGLNVLNVLYEFNEDTGIYAISVDEKIPFRIWIAFQFAWLSWSSLLLLGTISWFSDFGLCCFLQGLIHFMNIYSRLTFFLEGRSFGECFILLMLLCRNISDMAHGTAVTSTLVGVYLCMLHVL